MAYYKVVLNGRAFGQEVVNILWYRGVLPGALSLLDPTTGEDITFQVQQEVWAKMRPCMPLAYTLDNIAAYPYSNSLVPAFSAPYIRAVNAAGLREGETNGAAPTAIYRFNVASLPLINALYPAETALLGPRRGYLAIGPMIDGDIDPDGTISADYLNDADVIDFRQALEATLTNASPPALFVPVRARHNMIGGVLTLSGFAPVTSVGTRTRATFRRSRLAEPS